MKKLTILLALTVMCLVTRANDTVVVKHHAYTSVYAKNAHIPALVTYTLHAGDLSCKSKIARTNDFKADPQVPGTSLSKDYAGNGYDQGHNMSAQDNECSATNMEECFYYTNMYPQTPNLNRGIWKKLEVEERALATENDSIVVFIGSYGVDKKIGPDKVVVPAYCWKVIYIPKTKEWQAYIFPNGNNVTGTMDRYTEFTPAQDGWAKYLIGHYTRYRY